jgi:hypothetical protein
MLQNILLDIQKKNGDDAMTGTIFHLMTDIKNSFEIQQKKLHKIIEIKYSKIEKERLKKSKKKGLEVGRPFFNGIHTGEVNKKKLPNGKGTLVYASRDKDFPDEMDFYLGEFQNGTKTGIGQYTYFNDRNITQHPFTIPYYKGEWLGDLYYGLGKKIIDSFDFPASYEGEFYNNIICGFGKYSMTDKDGGSSDLYGYFINGSAVCYGVEVHKDKKGKVNNEKSGLVEYDQVQKTKTLIHRFMWDNFWKNLNTKKYKRVPIIQDIYNHIIDNFFKADFMTKKFKDLKLLLKKQLIELLLEVNSFWENNQENKKYLDFINSQNEFLKTFDVSNTFKELNEAQSLLSLSNKTFSSLKKELAKT